MLTSSSGYGDAGGDVRGLAVAEKVLTWYRGCSHSAGGVGRLRERVRGSAAVGQEAGKEGPFLGLGHGAAASHPLGAP